MIPTLSGHCRDSGNIMTFDGKEKSRLLGRRGEECVYLSKDLHGMIIP